jgi:hypothetical protein
MNTTSRRLAALAIAAIILWALRATADPVLIGEPGTTVRVSLGTNGDAGIVLYDQQDGSMNVVTDARGTIAGTTADHRR